MNFVKNGVVGGYEAQNGLWPSLLADNQFERITECVENAYVQAVAAGDTQRATLLAAAKQLCDSCAQMQHQVSFHQEAYHHSETRRDKLNAELGKLLRMMQVVPETAVSPQNHTVWQRVTHFLRPEKQQLVKLPKRAFPLEEENGVLDGRETAVSLPSHSPTVPLEAANPSVKSSRPRLTIYCLGTFRVYEDDYPIESWPSRKGKSIFKYLLLHRKQRITKEVLMAQFWPDATADAARNNLNVAIYGLRQALRNGHSKFSHILFQDDCYFLNPGMDIWVDMEAFAIAYRKARQLEKQPETAVAIHEYHAAEALYQGELFAEDRYDDWPAAQRQQLQMNYLQLLTCLSNHYFAIEQYTTCITFANKLLLVEPCHEATHRLMMRAYARQRQGYLALRQYHQCVETLVEELAVPPDPTTTQLYEAIRNHQII
jgi:DNA-binding SARP family transcriptional activator